MCAGGHNLHSCHVQVAGRSPGSPDDYVSVPDCLYPVISRSDAWAVARRYMSSEGLTKARLRLIDGDPEDVISLTLDQAV